MRLIFTVGILLIITFSAIAADKIFRDLNTNLFDEIKAQFLIDFKFLASNEETFLKHIVKTRKPVILSTGMSNMEEIKKSVKLFQKFKIPIAILQTTSQYPCNYEDINLKVIDNYKKIFNIPVGISDHSLGIYTALGAVARGASIVEKHITLDKKMKGPDQKLSLEYNELSELVKGCNAIKLALGNSKKILKKELPILNFARESVVVREEIVKGEKFTEM